MVAKLNKNHCSLYIDYSGPRLSDRGYRTRQGKAPIRENLAAALIKRSGWLNDVSQPLYDPCCGSGTLLIEAVGMANNVPANLNRKFAFENLPSFRKAKFDEIKQLLKSQVKQNNLWIMGTDFDEKVIDVAKQNARRAGVEKQISFNVNDANKLNQVANRSGVVLSNLPYGERLGAMAELISLYRNLGLGFKKYYLFMVDNQNGVREK